MYRNRERLVMILVVFVVVAMLLGFVLPFITQ